MMGRNLLSLPVQNQWFLLNNTLCPLCRSTKHFVKKKLGKLEKLDVGKEINKLNLNNVKSYSNYYLRWINKTKTVAHYIVISEIYSLTICSN